MEYQVVNIPIRQISPNPDQPRLVFQEGPLKELAASIKEAGILQPIVVRPMDSGRYALIVGERRFRACQLLGLEAIPALVRGDESASNDSLKLALIENIQRADLTIIEEARAYSELIKEFGYTHEACGKVVGKDRSSITNALRLLQLPQIVQDDLLAQRLLPGHGKALLALDQQGEIMKVRDLILKRGLTVRETEVVVRRLKKGGQIAPSAQVDPNLEYIATRLRAQLRTKVQLSGSVERGRIEISYFSGKEFERILAILDKGL